MATGLVLLFAFTAGGVIWLAGDVDRSISNRGAAQSIAFQAARSGAQQIDLVRLRTNGAVALDDAPARAAAADTATRLLAAYGLSGVVARMEVEGDRITVVLEVTDAGRTVTGVGVARASDGSGP